MMRKAESRTERPSATGNAKAVAHERCHPRKETWNKRRGNEKRGEQEDKLTCERKKRRLERLAGSLKIVRADNLDGNERNERSLYDESPHRKAHERRLDAEHGNDLLGKYVNEHEEYRQNRRCRPQGDVERPEHASVLARTRVEAEYGLCRDRDAKSREEDDAP